MIKKNLRYDKNESISSVFSFFTMINEVNLLISNKEMSRSFISFLAPRITWKIFVSFKFFPLFYGINKSTSMKNYKTNKHNKTLWNLLCVIQSRKSPPQRLSLSPDVVIEVGPTKILYFADLAESQEKSQLSCRLIKIWKSYVARNMKNPGKFNFKGISCLQNRISEVSYYKVFATIPLSMVCWHVCVYIRQLSRQSSAG